VVLDTDGLILNQVVIRVVELARAGI